MRTDLSVNRLGWLYELDHRKLIIIAFLLRFMCASLYDVFVSVTDKDILLPDSKFYSLNGRYIALLLNGYNKNSFNWNVLPADGMSRDTFLDIFKNKKGRFPDEVSESNLFFYAVGIIYFIFGYFPLGVRVFNILLSIAGTYLIFRIAERRFGRLTANLFLLIALFLPTQFGYSLTMSRDFLRVFVVCLILWVIYG